MRKSLKIISMLLVFTMITTISACTAKPSRSGVKHNDAESKPENPAGMATPVPTTTEPDDPTPTPTEPSDPTSTPTPTPAGTVATTPTTSVNIEDLTNYPFEEVYELMESIAGSTLPEAENMIMNYFDIDLGQPSENVGESGVSTSYTYSAAVMIGGVVFNNIELDVSMDGIVYYIDFFNDMDPDDVLMGYCQYYKELATDYLGEPYFEFPLEEDNSIIEFYDFHITDDSYVTVGAYYTGFSYSQFWFSYSDNSLR